MITRTLALFFTFILFGCNNSNEVHEKSSFDELETLIDQYVNNTIDRGNINALSVAIYKDGLVYKNYYGEIDKGVGNTPNDSTLFEIASISKIFVGSLMAKAVAEDKLSLEDDIRLYLDGDYSNLEYEGSPVRIRHLVTHTLGFSMPNKLKAVYDKIFDGYYQDKDIDYEMSDLLVELQSIDLDTIPGTKYEYSNVGPELAAYILEQVYEESYEPLLNSFLNDLEIRNVHVQGFAEHKKDLANGYDENWQVASLVKNPLLGGAGGLIAGLPDLTTFMQFQLESDNPLIKESTRYLFKDGEDDTGYYWDLGMGNREGFYYSKSGSSKGTESIMLICPDANYGMVMIMNNQSEAATNDWVRLYNRIENDVIEYPKVNLWSTIENDFFDHPKNALSTYESLKKDTAKYFISPGYLNKVAYEYIFNDEIQKAIDIFKFAISEYPDNANLYDSLGEAYFYTEEYDKSKENYEKSLRYNPDNTNAKEYLAKIAELTKT